MLAWNLLTIGTIALCAALLAPFTFHVALGSMRPLSLDHPLSPIAALAAGAVGIFAAPSFGRPGWRGWATSLALGLGVEIAAAALVGALSYSKFSSQLLIGLFAEERSSAEIFMMLSAAASMPAVGAVTALIILGLATTYPITIAASLAYAALTHCVARFERWLKHSLRGL